MRWREEMIRITLSLNGQEVSLVCEVGDTLLKVIREQAGLTGPKAGCENGDCGACTVLLDGRPVKSCMMLAVEAEGKKITTVEGLENTEIQDAFVKEGGFQCGYCTSGFLMNAYALLETHPEADRALKNKWLSANLCRCTGYEGIERAVDRAQQAIRDKKK